MMIVSLWPVLTCCLAMESFSPVMTFKSTFLTRVDWDWFRCMHDYFNLKPFAGFLWNQIKQFLKYDFLNSPALLLKSLFCMFTCEGSFDDQFRKYLLFFKPSLLLKSVCILTWELRSSRIILQWKHMKQFLKYNFFQIVITFEIRLHAYLQNT